MRKPWMLGILLTVSALSATTSRGDSLGARMDVSATVLANCQLVVPPLTFGVYDPLSSHSMQPADASATVTVSCTRNTGATLSFDFGLHAASDSDRSLAGPGSESLRYQIYRDAARSQVWARGADSVRILSRGISSPEQLTVFGRILPRQEVEPGAYTDVLTATVDF
jgi:spore coat protein U-like protein